METTDAEEYAIAALLDGCRAPAPPPNTATPNAAAATSAAGEQKKRVEMVRDRLVFDAACGGPGSWTTKLKQQETDFTEQRGDGWAASVSVVLSLLKVDTQTGAQELMHDEVGSGRAERASDAAAAEEEALKAAVACGRKRLGKRFAVALGGEILGAIETAAWKEATGHAKPPAPQWHGRGRGRGRGRG